MDRRTLIQTTAESRNHLSVRGETPCRKPNTNDSAFAGRNGGRTHWRRRKGAPVRTIVLLPRR